MSYKNWKLINESIGHNLGLTNPQNLGAVGSNYEEGKYMSRRSYMPPMVDDEEDEDELEDELEDDEFEDDEFGLEDELEDGEFEDDEYGDEFGPEAEGEFGDEEEPSFPPKDAGAEILGDEMGVEDEDEFGDEEFGDEEMGDEEMGDIGKDMDYDSSDILEIDPSQIGALDDEMGTEDEDEFGLEDEDEFGPEAEGEFGDEMGLEDALEDEDEFGLEDELEDEDEFGLEDEEEFGDEDLDDKDYEDYMGDMAKAHRKSIRKMMKKHEANIKAIQDEDSLNEFAAIAAKVLPMAAKALASPAGQAAAQGAGGAVADKAMGKIGFMKKEGGKSKKGKKGKKQMNKEHTETHDEFLKSLFRGAHNEQSKRYSDGLSEDALYVAQDLNANFGDLPTEPDAGEVGFAPQGAVGGAMGAGGYTHDDMGQIPVIGEQKEPETEEELDEWMNIAFGFGALTESAKPLNESYHEDHEDEEGHEEKEDEGHEEEEKEGCSADCKCKKCKMKKMKAMKMKENQLQAGKKSNSGKKHCNESVEVDFLTSLVKNAKRGRGGW